MKNWLFLNVTNHEKKLPYYIYGAGADYDQENVHRPEGCPWFQLNTCQSGNGILKMNKKEMKISEGDSLIIYPDVPHEYYPHNGKMIVSWIAFDGFQVGSMFNSIGISKSGIYRLINDREIHKSIKEILPIQNLSFHDQSYEGSRLVYSFLLTLMKNFNSDEKGKSDCTIEKITPALEYMKANISQPITIEDIADSINVTPQHFCLLFKGTLNQRPFEYLNSLRINHSKHLLLNNQDMPVQEISRLSGYPNHSYFCQLFKSGERLTPVEFRKLYRQNNN